MGTGLDALKDRLEQAIIKNTGRMKKTFRIPAVGGEHLRWVGFKENTQNLWESSAEFTTFLSNFDD